MVTSSQSARGPLGEGNVVKSQSDSRESERRVKNVLVLGVGSWAFGREKRAVTMLRHMARVRSFFLTGKWEDGSVSRLLQKYGFEFERTSFGYLGFGKPLWTLINLAQLPRLYVTLFRVYFRTRTDILLLLSIHSFVNAFLPILALKFFWGAKVVFYLGDIPRNNSFYRALARVINRVMERTIVISQAVKKGLFQVGIDESKITVIYNGVDLGKFESASPKEFRKRFGWHSDTVLIGYAGQFSQNKGVWDFVKAAELVLQDEQKCRFVMIGGVDEGDSCQRAISDYVKAQDLSSYIVFTGRIDEMEKAYAALDIVVVPSRYEDPAPNVNIEAMASGVPVIATRIGGNPELVVDGKTGFLVDKNNPAQIAERILQLARDGELREKIGRAGRERVCQMFDVRRNACLVEEVLLYG